MCLLKRNQFLKINNSCYAEDLKKIPTSLRAKFYVCNTSSVCLSRNKQQIQGQISENIRITETLTVLFTCITVYRSLKPLKNLRRSHQMILEMCCRVDTMSFNWTQTTTIELFSLQSSKNLEENYYFMF